jgi:hypothetical protein
LELAAAAVIEAQVGTLSKHDPADRPYGQASYHGRRAISDRHDDPMILNKRSSGQSHADTDRAEVMAEIST